ncbi:Maf family protein [Kordiimonas sp. SCSIO 12610]|uniref:Maf family protein n=1 Tax=Kordiimonas sp. SCSIO 12610 TaxID=2829597 RepID=UPI0021095339|nr:Maf family protein [Kordiimonas sp. SCSIO 12610]UTW55470.1 Maf family protein [Kordiimonas sp. SCSIO 12610]
MPKLILASQSFARNSMLKKASVAFETQKAMIDEEGLKASLLENGVSARDLADILADYKARSVSLGNPDNYVIGSDQVLECDNQIYSKANNLEDAAAKLMELQGKTHSLFSAAVVYFEGEPIWRFVDEVRLTMHPMTMPDIEAYLGKAGEDILGSVGCYHIEDRGVQLFSRISGDYFTILGMPLIPLLNFLKLHDMIEA